MEILQLEQKYIDLKIYLAELSSKRKRILKISEYLSFILSINNNKIIEPYLVEFIPDFLLYIDTLEIRGLNPVTLKTLQLQLNILNELNIVNLSVADINKTSSVLEEKISLMNNWMFGENFQSKNARIYFPVLEKNEYGYGSGYLEYINVEIKNGEQKFHISPADLENDEQLEKQVNLCFTKAIEYCSQYIKKIRKTHTVYLHFENRLGILTGNSLGAALTVSFIEAILKHYNSPIVVKINKTLAITGGINHDSKIISTSKTIIETKVETVFYSDADIMCVPKIDEMWAEEKLSELKKQHPNRNLKIIGLTDLDDILSRRNVVDIRKQKLIVRSGKFIKKNWISAVATVLLAILFAYLFVMDFDDNPANFSVDGQSIYIKNKNGKLLWEKAYKVRRDFIDAPNYLKGIVKIVNIDSDEQNEVLFAQLDDSLSSEKNFSDIRCHSYKGELIWRYSFGDTVSSIREKLLPYYGLIILDTLTINGGKNLFIRANNTFSFSSAILRINLRTGERMPGTFWCSGHTYNGFIKDINNDGKKDVLCVGLDNGYEDAVFFGYEIDTLTKVRITTDKYLIRGHQIANLINYIRLPKTDYDEYKKFRTPGISEKNFADIKSSRTYQFYTTDYLNDYSSCLWYQIDYNLRDVNIIVDSRFRVMRDTLVAHGKLPLPYTDTPEYVEIQKNKILYWKNGKWVKRKELD